MSFQPSRHQHGTDGPYPLQQLGRSHPVQAGRASGHASDQEPVEGGRGVQRLAARQSGTSAGIQHLGLRGQLLQQHKAMVCPKWCQLLE